MSLSIKRAISKTAARKIRRDLKKRHTKRGFAKHSTRVTTSSVDHKWRTPRKLLDLITKTSGRQIALDPCADSLRRYQFAKVNFTGLAQDGLHESWRRHGLVYANPPYGRVLAKWVTKACAEFSGAGGKDELFFLCPARVDTRWFQDLILNHASAVCFWRGRLTFGNDGAKDDPAPFPSMVVYFGRNTKRFAKHFSTRGWVYVTHKEKSK